MAALLLLSSHLLSDVERLADRVTLLHNGKLRVHCSLDEFRQRVSVWTMCFEGEKPESPVVPGLVGIRTLDDELQLFVADADQETVSMLTRLGSTTYVWRSGKH